MKLALTSNGASSLYYNYKNKFITLANLSIRDISESLELAGERFIVKSEFHITLLAVRQIAEIIDPQNVEKLQLEIVQDFYTFVEKNPLVDYELLSDVRLVTAGDNKTVIVMTKLKGIEDLFTLLEEKYRTALPAQPTHITLYTLPSDTFGIPILSYEELESISSSIDVPELNFDMINL